MSLKDGDLSAQERAALARLETQAEAEDPRLAARLSRPGSAAFELWLPSAEEHPWWGPVFVAAGVAIMLYSLSAPLAALVGTLGAVVCAGGLWWSTTWALARSASQGEGAADRAQHPGG
ncbi:MAG: DUF3040 domain-containing protein [Acidimicrobiales bacterium]